MMDLWMILVLTAWGGLTYVLGYATARKHPRATVRVVETPEVKVCDRLVARAKYRLHIEVGGTLITTEHSLYRADVEAQARELRRALGTPESQEEP